MWLLLSSPVRTLKSLILFFFFNDPATPEIYTLSLHDALPISEQASRLAQRVARTVGLIQRGTHGSPPPRHASASDGPAPIKSSSSAFAVAVSPLTNSGSNRFVWFTTTPTWSPYAIYLRVWFFSTPRFLRPPRFGVIDTSFGLGICSIDTVE